MEGFSLRDPKTVTRLTAPPRLAIYEHTIGKRGVLPAGCGVFLVGFLGIRYRLVNQLVGMAFLIREDDDVEDHAPQP